MYGTENPGKSLDGRNYDRVIPNYFRPDDFRPNDPTEDDSTNSRIKDKEPYFLFLGRLIHRKGITIAHQACKIAGVHLKIAGQGYKSWDSVTQVLVDQDSNAFQMVPRARSSDKGGDENGETGQGTKGTEGQGTSEFVGYANAETRRKLMLGATAVFCPSLYLEPFCGVAVEAQLCGTPVITTDFGAFPETVEQGKTGYRCLTLQDYVDAIEKVHGLDRTYIRQRALSLYSCDAVAVLYEKWFQDLYDVWESAHMDNVKGWSRIRSGASSINSTDTQ